jgi:hypothetical protein
MGSNAHPELPYALTADNYGGGRGGFDWHVTARWDRVRFELSGSQPPMGKESAVWVRETQRIWLAYPLKRETAGSPSRRRLTTRRLTAGSHP